MSKKTTKRALAMSFVSVFLCVCMLVGTTFAWFTDSVTSSNNIIKSGTLDVTMEWADGKTDPANTTWTDASKGAIFNNDLWEPGYVDAKHIQIKNVGTLAFKYKLNIVPDGAVTELADVIDVYYLPTATQVTRDMIAAATPIGTLADLITDPDGAAYGKLYPVGNTANEPSAQTVTIALKMRESATNEYQDLSIGSDFSVVLMATQKDYESDSFGDNYDATVDIPEMDIKKVNGVTYGAGADGNYYMISVDDYTLTNFTVDEDVTILGAGGGVVDTYDRVFGKNAPLETVALPEGLIEINNNALNSLPNLTEIDLPSTLEKIGSNGIAYTGITEVTIPASVKTLGDGAFRGSPNLTTVTVEGNTEIGNYAFRTCPKLTSIYLLGDDVTFTGTSMWATHTDSGACNTHTDCPGKITIYVKNAAVAAGAMKAQGTSSCYEVKILGDAGDGSDATEVAQVKNDTQFNTAIANGASTVVLGSGNYIIPDSAQGKTLTIVGNGDTVVANQNDGSYEGCDYSLDGATVTFEGVTINTDGHTYAGYARCSATYNNCTINGSYTLYGESVFNNCTFNVTGDYYNIWTWGAKNVKFNDCTFNTDGKSILVYNQTCDVYVDGCTFNDRTNGTGFTKSAFETGVDGVGPKYNIYINDTTVNGFAENDKCVGYKNIVGNKNSMTKEYLNIVIDGVDVY